MVVMPLLQFRQSTICWNRQTCKGRTGDVDQIDALRHNLPTSSSLQPWKRLSTFLSLFPTYLCHSIWWNLSNWPTMSNGSRLSWSHNHVRPWYIKHSRVMTKPLINVIWSNRLTTPRRNVHWYFAYGWKMVNFTAHHQWRVCSDKRYCAVGVIMPWRAYAAEGLYQWRACTTGKCGRHPIEACICDARWPAAKDVGMAFEASVRHRSPMGMTQWRTNTAETSRGNDNMLWHLWRNCPGEVPTFDDTAPATLYLLIGINECKRRQR